MIASVAGLGAFFCAVKAYARKDGYNLSVGVTKTLMHNTAMLDRFNSMSAKHANRHLNNTDFKELPPIKTMLIFSAQHVSKLIADDLIALIPVLTALVQILASGRA